MIGDGIGRRLRGAIGNGLVWGAAWSALWVVVVLARAVLGLVGVFSPLSWLDVLGGIVRFGVLFGFFGFLVGTATSSVLGLLHRGRRVAGISPVRFGLGGGLLAGLLVPAFLQPSSLLSGDGIVAWALVLDDASLSAVFGALAAGGSLALAQRADRSLPAGPDPRRDTGYPGADGPGSS